MTSGNPEVEQAAENRFRSPEENRPPLRLGGLVVGLVFIVVAGLVGGDVLGMRQYAAEMAFGAAIILAIVLTLAWSLRYLGDPAASSKNFFALTSRVAVLEGSVRRLSHVGTGAGGPISLPGDDARTLVAQVVSRLRNTINSAAKRGNYSLIAGMAFTFVALGLLLWLQFRQVSEPGSPFVEGVIDFSPALFAQSVAFYFFFNYNKAVAEQSHYEAVLATVELRREVLEVALSGNATKETIDLMRDLAIQPASRADVGLDSASRGRSPATDQKLIDFAQEIVKTIGSRRGS